MRTSTTALAATIALAAATYGARLDDPTWDDARSPHYLFDERYTAFTAHRLLEGDPSEFKVAARRYEYAAVDQSDLTLATRAEWSHPPGAPLTIAPFVAAFGYSALGARLAAMIASIAALIATAALAGRRAAWCACALLGCDGMFFVFARTAMSPIFLLAALASFAAVLTRTVRARGRRQLVLGAGAGLLCGYAASVRWSAVPIALAILVATAASRGAWRRLRPRVGLVICSVALATYVATFAPFLLRGHSLGELLRLHRSMLWFHTHLPAGSAQSSPWFAWPWELRSIELGSRVEAGGRTAVVWCTGGRLLWWALVPALLYGAWRARRGRLSDLVPVAAIAATWLPWAVLARYGYAYDLLPALPFAASLIARLLVASRLRAFAPLYVGVAVLLFAATYPVLASVPLVEGVLSVYRAAFRT